MVTDPEVVEGLDCGSSIREFESPQSPLKLGCDGMVT